MNRERRRTIYALFSTITIYGALFGGLVFMDQSIGCVSDREIFEATDYMDNLKNPKIEAKNGENTKKMVLSDNFELILCDDSSFNGIIFTKSAMDLVETPKEIKKKIKFSPIVKSPFRKPRLLQKTPIPYPNRANGAEGTVVVCILVGLDGKAEYVSTADSSGSPILDGAAVERCINWKFVPAEDKKGRKVRCLIYIPVDVKR